MICHWPDGTIKSMNNAFTGDAPITAPKQAPVRNKISKIANTNARASYAKRKAAAAQEVKP